MAYEGLGEITFRRRALPGCLSIREVQDIVCDHFKVSHQDLISESRKQSWARPRQIAMYLCREYARKSYPEIARAFGDRDHTTIIFAYRKLAKTYDPGLVDALAVLRPKVEEVLRERFGGTYSPSRVGMSAQVAEANVLLMCAA